MSDDATTTAAPASSAPPAESTQAPANQSTEAPADQSTQAPADQSTQAPADQSTQAPADQSTQAPADQSTQAPADQSTQAPADQSTQAPGDQTTQAPGATTTAGSGPSVTGVIEIDPPGAPQNPNSIQVPNSATLTLTWNATNAASVTVSGIDGSQGVSGSTPIKTEDATFTLTAIGSDGTPSAAFTIEVATHDDGDVVSDHADVASGVAAIISFNAVKDGAAVTSANIGDEITLTAVVSDSTDSCTIFGQDAGLASGSDGNKIATTSVTIAGSMSGDFDCQVSCGGQAGDSGSVHIDIGTASSPSSTTTSAPGTTTTASPAITTTAPAITTTLAPVTTTTAAPGTTTSAPPSNATTAGPNETTTGAPPTTHPPTTSTEKETEDGQILFTKTQVLLEPKDEGGDEGHFTLSPEISAKVTVLWQGAPESKPEMTELPDDLQGQVDDGCKTKFTVPFWDVIQKGGTWKSKEYSDFWAHITGTTGVDTKENAEGKKEAPSITVGTYEFGEIDYEAAGSEPAFSIVLSASVAAINLKEPMASGIGVITGTYSLTAFAFQIDSGDFRVKVDVSGELTATITAATVKDIIEAIGKNPYVALAAALIICTVGMVYVIIETPSYDSMLALGTQATNLRDTTVQQYLAGLRGTSSDGAGAQGQQARTQFWSDMDAKNPGCTDDDKSAQLEQQIPGLTDQLNAYYLPKCQDAVWDSWGQNNSGGAKALAVTDGRVRIAWASVYGDGVEPSTDPRFLKYFPATQQEQDTNAAAKMTDDQKQAAWDTWAQANDGMFGESKAAAAGKFLEFFPDCNDAMSDPRFTKYWS